MAFKKKKKKYLPNLEILKIVIFTTNLEVRRDIEYTK